MKQMMIIGGLTLVLGLAGCSSKVTFGINRGQVQETMATIEEVIPEPERREALLEIVESYKAEMVKIETEAVALRQEINELNRDFDAPREELEVRYDRLGELTQAFGDTAKVNSLKAKAICSEEEWSKIAPRNLDPFSFTFEEAE